MTGRNNFIEGASEDDTINVQRTSFTIVTGGGGNDTITGNAGGDTLRGGSGDDTITGGAYVDILTGGSGADTIYGGEGNDWIRGGSGNDAIEGGAGDDTIFGDAGDDTIIDSGGDDTLTGGAGPDDAAALGALTFLPVGQISKTVPVALLDYCCTTVRRSETSQDSHHMRDSAHMNSWEHMGSLPRTEGRRKIIHSGDTPRGKQGDRPTRYSRIPKSSLFRGAIRTPSA